MIMNLLKEVIMYRIHVFDENRKFLSFVQFDTLKEAIVYLKNLPNGCKCLMLFD